MALLDKILYIGGSQMEQTSTSKPLDASYRQPTITEHIDSQIKHHKNKIADLEEAKAALTPDVEKALNALAKIS